jgi:DNA-binding beta-propeller fold protein YncE
MENNSTFEIETREDRIQSLAPPNSLQRFEGLAFSSCGNIIAVATSDTNSVFLFRRKSDGLFEEAPYGSIEGPRSRLNYPHDVSFSMGDSEMLAVAQRSGAIAIYERQRRTENYGPDPVFEICGAKAKLDYSDGVSFVPPNNDYLAACNLQTNTVSFYRKTSCSPITFDMEPLFVLKHPSIFNPDGLAFSQCGTWLAVANHGNHSVSIFQRRNRIFSKNKIKYGPKPVMIIKDPGLRHPHSLAFTPETNHLVVTNAGANYFSVYEPKNDYYEMQTWSQSAVVRKAIGPEGVFREINARNKMEGGPKGVATHKNTLAVCSPEHGIKIYSFRECLTVL